MFVFCISGCTQAKDIDVVDDINSEEPVPIPLIFTPNSFAEISYTHEKLKNGKGNKAKITAFLNIEKELEDGFLANWTTKSVEIGDVLITEDSPQASSLFIGVPFSFLAGADGQPMKIHDKENLIAGLSKSPAFKDIDSDVMKSTIGLFESMDEETLAHIMIKVPSFMSVCQETEFIIGQPLESEVEAPSPFGEGILISDISYELTLADNKSGIAEIKYRSGFNAESLKQLTLDLFKKIAPDKTPSEEEMETLEIDRQDSADCSVDMSTGWVSKMNYSTFVKSEGETQQEVFDISVNWVE